MTDIIPINMSAADRLLRLAAGLAIVSLYFVGPRMDWALLGLVAIATAALGFCPIYALAGRGPGDSQVRGSHNRH